MIFVLRTVFSSQYVDPCQIVNHIHVLYWEILFDNGYIYSIYVYVFGFILKTNSKSLYVKRCFEFVYNFI